jgi:hypothetical protein
MIGALLRLVALAIQIGLQRAKSQVNQIMERHLESSL